MTADDGFCLTSPEARVRAPRPARVTDRDPYRVPGPAVWSVSLPCDCTQRRMPPVPCVCPEPRRVPREGHTLACAALRAEARRPGPEGLAVRAAHERHHVGGRRRDRAWRLAGRGEWREWMGEMTAEDHAAWARAAAEADAGTPRIAAPGVSP